jgi:hypothetical protein
MEKTFINLTLPLIYAEIDQVLAADLYCVQTELGDRNDIRQELASYALRRVQCRYRILQEPVDRAHLSHFSRSLEEALEVEKAVRQSVYQMIRQARAESSLLLLKNHGFKIPSNVPALTPQI